MINPLPISKSFTTLQAWANTHAPGISFRPPANPAAIAKFIDLSGLTFPEELRELLLQADGETRHSAGMIGNWRMMPIVEIQAAWGYLTQVTKKGAFEGLQPGPSPYIQKTWWRPGWIPFVSSDTGDYFCIDTDPIEPQRAGQVILFLQEHPERFLVAPSLGAWLDQIARDLISGVYTYHPEEGFTDEAFMRSALEGKHYFEGKRNLIASDDDDEKDNTP